MEEIWKPVKGYENYYQVSNNGIIKSNDRYILCSRNHRYLKKGRILKTTSPKGYKMVKLCINNIHKGISVHRIVAETFISNPDNKQQVNHKNMIKQDNNVNNLEWVTNLENVTHAFANNKNRIILKGSKHKMSKLNLEIINQIFDLYKNGKNKKEIAAITNLHRSTVEDLLNRKSWLHLSIDINGKYNEMEI